MKREVVTIFAFYTEIYTLTCNILYIYSNRDWGSNQLNIIGTENRDNNQNRVNIKSAEEDKYEP